ncbi:MAG: FAD-binding protein [Gracilibacteraceae bacterium]|jgi:electron transfer flavoprotein alpha subunit|nr:FAD-binding protein [Gracilibacteraceae bacterium]
MKKLKSVWIIAGGAERIAELSAGAAAWGEETALIYAGDREKAAGAGTVYYLGPLTGVSYLSYIPAIVALVREKQPELVLVESSCDGRLTAAAIAAAVGVSALTDIDSLEADADGGGIVGRRMIYGGAAWKTERVSGPTAVVCVGAGVFPPGETAPPPGEVIELRPEAAPGTRLLEQQKKPAPNVNLPAAGRIVGVGRGLGTADNLGAVRAFAAALGAEIGCSRPVAEEERWLPKERYIGVSGVIATPEVYIACGVSGQVQHMAGIDRAGVIAAVNKDKNAPVFRQCDYGLVADLNAVLPRLTELFNRA